MSIAVWMCLAASCEAAPIYIVQDLGTLGGTSSAAYALNDGGMAAGSSSDLFGTRHAFTSLGPELLSLPAIGEAVAAGVNSQGAVAGTAYGSGGAQATVWRDGNAIYSGPAGSYGMGINEAGQLTGSANGKAFLSSNGVTTLLTAFRWSSGYAVNASGQVAGYGMQSNGSFQAFLWTPTGGVAQIAGLGGNNSYAMAVNASGQVAGSAQLVSGYSHAFLANGGQTTDLGTLGGGSSYGYGMNAAGQVVGYSWTASNQVTHAFLYSDGQMIDLNSLITTQNWILTQAFAINASGQIVGSGLFNGVEHAFRIDPVVAPVQAQVSLPSVSTFDAAPVNVPEPATFGMAAMVGVWLALRFLITRRNSRRG